MAGGGMAPGDEAEFAAFVAARSRALLRTAFLLCGDWGQAEDLLQTALGRTYVAWRGCATATGPRRTCAACSRRHMWTRAGASGTASGPPVRRPSRPAWIPTGRWTNGTRCAARCSRWGRGNGRPSCCATTTTCWELRGYTDRSTGQLCTELMSFGRAAGSCGLADGLGLSGGEGLGLSQLSAAFPMPIVRIEVVLADGTVLRPETQDAPAGLDTDRRFAALVRDLPAPAIVEVRGIDASGAVEIWQRYGFGPPPPDPPAPRPARTP